MTHSATPVNSLESDKRPLVTPELSLLLATSARAVQKDPSEARSLFRQAAQRNDPNPGCPHCGKRHRTLTPDQCVDRSMSEAKLQQRVLYRARKHGWKVAHAGRGQVGETADGGPMFITPMSKGWPDLACFKPGHKPVFLELKRELGEVEPEQWEWLELLGAAGCMVGILRPSDLREGRVETIFRRGAPLRD